MNQKIFKLDLKNIFQVSFVIFLLFLIFLGFL